MEFLARFHSFLSSPAQASKVTVKNYKADISHFITWYEAKYSQKFNPNLVNAAVLEDFRTQAIENLSQSSVNRHMSSLRKFFHYLKIEGLASKNPFDEEKLASQSVEEDPFRLKDFKNNLYVYNASKLTIKNYLIDVKQFLTWAETVLGTKEELDLAQGNVFRHINSKLIEEYKHRLLNEGKFSPASVNRKLSSIRKYISWASEEGLIPQPSFEIQRVNESKVLPMQGQSGQPELEAEPEVASSRSFLGAPKRLVSKLFSPAFLLAEHALISPLAHGFDKVEHAVWSLKGKPIFHRNKGSFKVSFPSAPRESLPKEVHNLPKAMFAPQKISTKYLPVHKKVWFHARYTRPNWYKRYHSYPIATYINLAILIIFMTAVGFGFYNTLFGQANKQKSALAAPSAPPRILSFQGRLTDVNSNPITSTTLVRFTIYNDISASGAAKLWEEQQGVSPDSDGIFSVLLGNITSIPASVFTDNPSLYLGVTVGFTPELSPRQRLATVAFASNSESLQGMVPLTTDNTSLANKILNFDSSGNLTFGGSTAPVFQATGGQFTISGSGVILTTTTGSGSNVTVRPDGLGKIDLQKPLQNTTINNNIPQWAGALEVDDSLGVLATSSSQAAFWINEGSTGDLINASTSGNLRFRVDSSGNVTNTGTLTVQGNTISVGNGSAATINTPSGNANLSITPNGSGTLNLGTAATNVVSIGNATGTVSLTLGSDATGDLFTRGSGGNIQRIADVALGSCLTSGGIGAIPAWGSCGNGTNWWANLNGTLYPLDLSEDLLVGGNSTASASFHVFGANNRFQGTSPVASISANTSYAGLVVNQNGSGDLLTASSAGKPLFTVLANGNISLNGGAPVVSSTGTNTLTLNQNSTGSVQFFSASNSISNGGNLTLGGTTITASNLTTFTTSASLSITAGTLNLGNGGNATVATTSNGNLTLAPAGSGNLYLDPSGTGFVGINTSAASLLSNLDIRGASGTISIASVSGKTSFASLVIDQTGLGDIFTASSAGKPLFTITSSGAIGLGAALNIGSSSQCLVGGANPSWGTCGSGTNFWGQTNGTLYPLNSTVDLLIGGQSTSSAKFAVLNINSGVPVASVSGAAGAMYFTADGHIDTTAKQGISIGSNATSGQVSLGNSSGNFFVEPAIVNDTTTNNGFVKVLDKFFVSGSESTGNSLAVFDNSGGGDLITASSSGTPEFTVGNSGAITDAAYTNTGGILYTSTTGLIGQTAGGSATQCLLGGTTPSWGSCNITNWWANVGGAIYPVDLSEDLLIGGSASTSASFHVYGANPKFQGTVAVASASSRSSFATLVVNQNGLGDIITASSAGKPLFTVQGSGNVLLGGGAPSIDTNGGGLNIGTNTSAGLTLGKSGQTTTFNSTSWTATPTISGLITATSGLTSNGTLTVSNGNTFTANGQVNLGDNGDNVVIDSNTWDISGAGVASGFTGFTSSGTITLSAFNGNNAVLYGTAGSGQVAQATTSTPSLCLVSNAGGTNIPAWATCPASLPNYWEQLNGALYPLNDTVDFLVGGHASTSAKFAVLNVNNGTPTASVSSGLNGNGTYLTSSGILGTARKKTLQIGDSNTGDINFYSTSNVLNSSGNLTLAGSANLGGNLNFTGTNPSITNTGSNTLTINSGSTGNIQFFSGSNTLDSSGNLIIAGDLRVNGNDIADSAGNNRLSFSSNTITLGSTTTLTDNSLATINSAATLAFSGDITITGNDITNTTLNLGGGSSATLGTTSNGSLTLAPAGSGNLILDPSGTGLVDINHTNAPLASLDIRQNSGTIAVASVSGKSSFANLVVDQTGLGDIFTASNSGKPLFTVLNSGNISLGGGLPTIDVNGSQNLNIGTGNAGTITIGRSLGGVTIPSPTIILSAFGSGLSNSNAVLYARQSDGLLQQAVTTNTGSCLLSNGSGGNPSWGSCGGGSSINYWEQLNGSLYPLNDTVDFFVGGHATSSAKFAVLNVNSGTPVASISSGVSGNSTFITADGTLSTTRRANLTIGNSSTYNTTGNVLINSNGQGNVGIGTTSIADDGNGAGGGAGVPALYVKNNVSGKFTKLILDGPTDGGTGIEFYGGGATKGDFDYAQNLNVFEFSARAANAPLLIKTFGANNNTNEVLRITSGETVGLNVNGATPLGTLDVRANIFNGGTISVASVSGKTSFASLVVDQSGLGDIFTASASGLNRFVIQNNGNVGIGTTLPTSALHVKAASGNIAQFADNTQVRFEFQPDSGSGATLQFDSGIGIMKSQGFFQLQSAASDQIKFQNTSSSNEIWMLPQGGNIYTGNTTSLVLGANQSTTQLVLANGGNVGIGTTNPQNRLAIGLSGGTTQNVVGQYDTQAQANQIIFGIANTTQGAKSYMQASSIVNGSDADGILTFITTHANVATSEKLRLDRDGNLSLNGTSALATLDIRQNPFNGGSLAIASVSGKTFFPTLVLDQSGAGAIFSASSSGQPRFTITQTGGIALGLATNIGTSAQCLLGGSTATWGSCGGGTNWWNNAGGALDPLDLSADLLIGGNATTSASFHVYGANPRFQGTSPVASIAANTSFAALVVDNKGSGDLITASSSAIGSNPGRTQFRVDNQGGVYGRTFYDLDNTSYFLDPAATGTSLVTAGSIGVATTSAIEKLTVAGNVLIEQRPNTGLTASNSWTKISGTTGTIGGGATTSIASVSASVVYNGDLYVGTTKSNAAEIYRVTSYNGSSTGYTKVSQSTAGTISAASGATTSIDGVTSMTVWNGKIYAGTTEPGKAEVYRYDGGTTWTLVIDRPGSFNTSQVGGGGAATTGIDGITALTVFNGALYAGTAKVAGSGSGAEVYRYEAGTSGNVWAWITDTTASLFKADSITGFAQINGVLIASTLSTTSQIGGVIIVPPFPVPGTTILSLTGTNPPTTGVNGGIANDSGGANSELGANSILSVSSMAVFQGNLYIGIRQVTSGQAAIYRYASGIINSFTLSSFNGEWQRITPTFGTIGSTTSVDDIPSMTVYQNKLYIGTSKAGAAEIYRYDPSNATGSAEFTKVSQNAAGTIASGGTTAIDSVVGLQPYGDDLIAFTKKSTTNAEIYNYNVVNDQSFALKFHAASSAGFENGFTNTGSIYFDASPSASFGGQGGQGEFVFSNSITTKTGAYDVAEDYPTRDTDLEAGDIVSTDTHERGFVTKTAHSQDPTMIGVYSTNPALHISQADLTINGGNAVPIALVGRVPIKVSTESGVIKIGDPITSSSVPGVGMKATTRGPIIAKALEPYDPSIADANGYELIMGYVTNQYFDPNPPQIVMQARDLANYVLARLDDGTFAVRDAFGNVIDSAQAFASAMIGNLSAGIIHTADLFATNTTTNNLTADVITPLQQDLTIKIASNSGKFLIKNPNNKVVASVDTSGNATFSGKLASDSLQTNDATVSGTLHAGKIIADDIVGLPSSSPSANYITNNYTSYYFATPSANINASDSGNLADNFDGNYQLASLSAQIANVNQINGQTATFYQGLMAFGPSSLYDVSVADQLSVGSQLTIADHSINVLGADLQIQPLRQGGVDFLAGAVKIDVDGNLTVNGNATFAKNVSIQGILSANILSSFADGSLVLKLNGSSGTNSALQNVSVKNASNSSVFTITSAGDFIASGAGSFSKLNLSVEQKVLALSDTELIATGSAGVATISAHQSEITIDNPLVTDKSLIYITPKADVSDVGGVYLMRQVPGKSFTVGINSNTNVSIPFNWIIVN